MMAIGRNGMTPKSRSSSTRSNSPACNTPKTRAIPKRAVRRRNDGRPAMNRPISSAPSSTIIGIPKTKLPTSASPASRRPNWPWNRPITPWGRTCRAVCIVSAPVLTLPLYRRSPQARLILSTHHRYSLPYRSAVRRIVPLARTDYTPTYDSRSSWMSTTTASTGGKSRRDHENETRELRDYSALAPSSLSLTCMPDPTRGPGLSVIGHWMTLLSSRRSRRNE